MRVKNDGIVWSFVATSPDERTWLSQQAPNHRILSWLNGVLQVDANVGAELGVGAMLQGFSLESDQVN